MLVVARLLQCSDVELPQVPWQNILAAKTRTERRDCVKNLINYPQGCMGKSERTESYAISNWNLNFMLRKRRLMPIVAHKTSNRFWLKPDCCCKGDWLEKPNPTSARVTLNVRVLMELGKRGNVFFLLLYHGGAGWFNALGHGKLPGKLPCLPAAERSNFQWFALIYKIQILSTNGKKTPKCKVLELELPFAFDEMETSFVS